MKKFNLKKKKPFYFDKIAKTYQKNLSFNKSGKYIEFFHRKIILAKISKNCGPRYLDLGCGDGTISKHILAKNKKIKEATFLDFSTTMIKLIKKSTKSFYSFKKKYILSDTSKFKTKQKYNLIIAVGICGHIVNLENLIKILKKNLDPDGKILFQYTKKNHLFSIIYRFIMSKKKHQNNEEYSWHSTKLIINKLQKHNLKIQKKYNYKIGIPFLDFFSPKLNYLIEKKFQLFGRYLGTETIMVIINDKKTDDVLADNNH